MPLLISIVQKAQEDAHITPEEAEIINIIRKDIELLEKEISAAFETGDIEKPKEIYKNSMATIINNAKQAAMRDGKISDDEKAIIDKLAEKLEEYQLKY